MLDDTGLAIGDRRIDLDSPDAGPKVKELADEAYQAHRAIKIVAARNARIRWMVALAKSFGAAGTLAIDVTTPSKTISESETFALSPPGQVPAHEDRCGVRAVVGSTGIIDLQHTKAHSKRYAADAGLSEIAKALSDARDRMKGCTSTVWMLAGEGDALWGAAFDIGKQIARTPTDIRAYLMVL